MAFRELHVGERAVEKLAARGIEEWEAYEVWFGRRVIVRNKKDRAGSHRVIGRTSSGRSLTFPIRQTEDTDLWEVVTGWESSEGERLIWARRAR